MGFLDATGVTTLVTKLKDYFVLSSDTPSLLAGKQDTLVSGTNIKTVGGNSILGSGDIAIPSPNYTVLRMADDISGLAAFEGSGTKRIWFSSADGTKMVPINTSTSASVTTAKTLNSTPINPFLPIVYYDASVSSGGILRGNDTYLKCRLTIGYSYVITLTANIPVYAKCTPVGDGSVRLSGIVQALPTSTDGEVYIYLGIASSSSKLDLSINHPIFYYSNSGQLRTWTGEVIVHGGGSND